MFLYLMILQISPSNPVAQTENGPLWLTGILLIIPIVYVLLTLIYIGVQIFKKDQGKKDIQRTLAILVAARDEEDNILTCMEALNRVNYPKDKLEIWIGDDDSTDKTGEIIQEYIKTHPHFHYVRITEQLPKIHGKQNVLAQLARKSSSDLIMITDADIQVHPDWPSTLAAHFETGVGMVCGPTLVDGPAVFTKMQSLDWLMGCTIARSHSILGIPITGVGNNMALLREAYESIGGYEKVPFSVTEDYKLFQILCEKGSWKMKMLFEPAAVNISEPMFTLQQWFRQRRRWFRGGLELAWYNLAGLFINALSIPSVILLLIFAGPTLGIAAYAAKVTADFLILATGAVQINRAKWLWWFPLYEVYYHIIAVVTPIQQLIPGKVRWKGREY